MRGNLKASVPQTQAEQAAAARMHDNYIPPEHPQPPPPPPPPEVDATMGDSQKPPPPPPPPPVGQPVFIPMRETNETLNHGNVRRRVRKKAKEHNTTATRQPEIIKSSSC